MGTRLYVGNLPYSVTDEALEQLFASVGTVTSATVVKDRDTGRPRGFGFVEMSTEEQAQEAIAKVNGQTLDDRTLVVNEARERAERGAGSGRGGFRRGGGYGGGRSRY